MKHALVTLILIQGGILAGEPNAFTPPRPYPLSRYEAGWKTNPFTLKTTPAAVSKASFAEHLVIGSVYGNLADPTVVVVNVKTHERIRLRAGRPAENGIKLEHLHRDTGKRTGMRAVLSFGAETSEIHYGTSYLKQMAAAETARATQSVLQQRQQSIHQHSGSPAMPGSNAQQQPAAAQVVSAGNPMPVNHQDALFAASPVNLPLTVNRGSTQTDPSTNDSHASNSHASTPSLAGELLGTDIMSLRRHTFRTGDEPFIPHPDPQ